MRFHGIETKNTLYFSCYLNIWLCVCFLMKKKHELCISAQIVSSCRLFLHHSTIFPHFQLLPFVIWIFSVAKLYLCHIYVVWLRSCAQNFNYTAFFSIFIYNMFVLYSICQSLAVCLSVSQPPVPLQKTKQKIILFAYLAWVTQTWILCMHFKML